MRGELPERQIVEHVRAQSFPAWMLVDDEGRLTDFGGDLERYGLDGLRVGDDLGDHAPVFDGLEPSRAEPLLLRSVAFAASTFADVHAARVAEGRSYLLLDCTESAGLLMALQQKANELELQMTHGDASLRSPTLADVVAGLGVVVFQLGTDGSLALVGRQPDWWQTLSDRLALIDGTRLDVGEDITPFLGHFLGEAHGFWSRGVPGRLRSGLWTERCSNGVVLPLEATAMLSSTGHRALLVQRMEESFQQQRRTLQQARDTSLRLERLNRDVQQKEVLLHCIVHDLKGPLSVILGGLELMRRPTLAEDKRAELVTMGIEQGERQLEMIRLILDVFSAEIASMEEFERDPERAPDAVAIVREVVEAYTPLFDQRGVALRADIEAAGDARVVGQEDRFRRVLMNLLENALRYAPRGTEVAVLVRRIGSELEIAVEDAGPGVAATHRETIFEKLQRDRRSGGMAGLGLYFCRYTVDQWGGTIGYSPRVPRGSRFWLRLPLAAQSSTTGPSDDA